MCIACQIGQMMPLLSMGYDPTAADIADLVAVTQDIQAIAQEDVKFLKKLDKNMEVIRSLDIMKKYNRTDFMMTTIENIIEEAQFIY